MRMSIESIYMLPDISVRPQLDTLETPLCRELRSRCAAHRNIAIFD